MDKKELKRKMDSINSPLVSIVMTAYNCESFICEAIKSILAQTLKEYELIIVDDGSTDCTKEKITTIIDPRVKFYSINHRGRAGALNYAMNIVQCSYVAFMDADDIALPTRIEKEYQILQSHKKIGIVSGWFQLIDLKGRELPVVRKTPEKHKLIEYEITSQCSICFGCCMVRKNLIRQIGGFNENIVSAVDYDLLLRMLPFTECYNLQEVLYYYRVHKSAITSTHHKEQVYNTYEFARKYLIELFKKSLTCQEVHVLHFRLGINEYYRGSMQVARSHFLVAFESYWRNWSFWRYLLPTFMGNSVFQFYRHKKKNPYIS